MSGYDIELWIYYRAVHEESIEQRHIEFMRNMSLLGSPLGFEGVDLPAVPDCGSELCAVFGAKYSIIRGLRFQGSYQYRDQKYQYKDKASYDDTFRIGFKTSNSKLDYKSIIHEHFPKVIKAYRGYRANLYFDLYLGDYCGGLEYSNGIYNRLHDDKSIDVNGRNNIFTLHPAQYWDAQLCQRALGYSPDEVISRLSEKVPKIELLMDGVYVVLNDDPDLSYAAFVEMNNRYKPILGLI
jgi:hypothetical protein